MYPIQIVGSKAYNWLGRDWDAQIISDLEYDERLNVNAIIRRHAKFMRRMGCEGPLDLWLITKSKNKLLAVKEIDGKRIILPYKQFDWVYCL